MGGRIRLAWPKLPVWVPLPQPLQEHPSSLLPSPPLAHLKELNRARCWTNRDAQETEVSLSQTDHHAWTENKLVARFAFFFILERKKNGQKINVWYESSHMPENDRCELPRPTCCNGKHLSCPAPGACPAGAWQTVWLRFKLGIPCQSLRPTS